MTLMKQNIPVALTQGINSKVDDKLLQGYLKSADNIQMIKSGRIQKRYGTQLLGTTDSAGNDLTTFTKLGTFDTELLAYANGSIYSYASSLSKWFNKGGRVGASVSSKEIIRNAYEQSIPSSCTVNNVTLIAWEDGRGGVRASVIDESTGNSFINDSSLDSSAVHPKCIAVGNSLVVFYVDSSNVLKMREVNSLNPSSFTSEVTVGTCNATGYYDIELYSSSRAVVCHSTTAGTELRFAYILVDSLRVGSSLDGVPNPATFTAFNPTQALNIYKAADNTIYAFYYNSSNGVYYLGVSNIFGASLAQTQISSSTATNVFGGVAFKETSANVFQIFYDRAASATNDYRVVTATVNSAGTVSVSETTLLRSVSLVSKLFNSDYMVVGYNSINEFQDTYFVMNTSGEVVSRFFVSTAGGHLNKAGMITEVNQNTSGDYIFTTQVKTKFIQDENEFFTENGISKIALSFSYDNVFFKQLKNNTHITGGILSVYDGKQVVEQGFNYYPEDISNTQATGGSLTTTGVYSYIVFYQWEDAKGQIHRSTTSLPYSVTLTGSNNKITLTIPTLRLTEKADVTIQVYRTVASGTVYYRLTPFNSPLINVTTADSVDYEDTAADNTITDNEVIYTTGGILDNSPAPSSDFIEVFQNRLWVVDDNILWYSKELREGEAVNFSEFLQLNVDPQGGSIKGLKALDNNLIIFKETLIYAVNGQGANNAGQGGSYNVQLITSDVGTISANSIVSFDQGIMFKSRKGIYLLSRGLSSSYIGAPVEGYNSLTTTAAVLKEDNNEIRFLHSDGQCLVYNYYFNQWYTFSNYKALHALSLASTFYKINASSSYVSQEVADYYGDNGAPITMKVETGWISFAGLQGFKRIYEFQTVGDYNSKHSALIKLSYDFNEAVAQQFAWTPGINKVYGEESPYGSEIYGGGSSYNSWYYRFKPAKQKCTSIKLTIEDTYPDSNLDKGFELNGLMFVVGNKGTARKPNNGLTINT